MYNFVGIWPKLEELLNFEVTATLRQMKNKKQNKTKQNKKFQGTQERNLLSNLKNVAA